MTAAQTFLHSDEAGWFPAAGFLRAVFTPVVALIFVSKTIYNQRSICHNIYFWTTGIVVFYSILILKD